METTGENSPVLDLVSKLRGNDWPEEIVSDHDKHLADAYRERCSGV
jgi:hypothetical protein